MSKETATYYAFQVKLSDGTWSTRMTEPEVPRSLQVYGDSYCTDSEWRVVRVRTETLLLHHSPLVASMKVG